jgi:hypothetical protein
MTLTTFLEPYALRLVPLSFRSLEKLKSLAPGA